MKAEAAALAAGVNTSGLTVGMALLGSAMAEVKSVLDAEEAGAALEAAVQSTCSVEGLLLLEAAMRAVAAAGGGVATSSDTFRCR